MSIDIKMDKDEIDKNITTFKDEEIPNSPSPSKEKGKPLQSLIQSKQYLY